MQPALDTGAPSAAASPSAPTPVAGSASGAGAVASQRPAVSAASAAQGGTTSSSQSTSAGMPASVAGGTVAASSQSNGGMSASAVGGNVAAGSGGAAGQLSAGGAVSAPPAATSSFPAIMDPWRTGPFAVATLSGAGPSNNATVLYPRELGKDGLKHPIVVWDNGKGQTGLSIYADLLRHLASHGFAVYAAASATDGGKEIADGLDWMVKQAEMSGGMFFQKLDTTKTAAMGHSQGSIATFAIAADPRLTTTIHLSGGTNPDIAQGHATLPNLHHPAAFLCGEEPGPGADGLTSGDVASPWCKYDFENTMVPVFLAQIQGASHISAPGMTLGACAAWLRWHLMGDTSMKVNFVGDDCTLCMRRDWMCKAKGLM